MSVRILGRKRGEAVVGLVAGDAVDESVRKVAAEATKVELLLEVEDWQDVVSRAPRNASSKRVDKVSNVSRRATRTGSAELGVAHEDSG